MSLIDSLTPKNTEEIKPGLFIQQNRNGYRNINPIAWNGELRLRKQFGLRNLFVIALIIFIAFSYYNDTKTCRDFQANPCDYISNYTTYCMGINENYNMLYGEGEVIKDGEKFNTSSLQSNP